MDPISHPGLSNMDNREPVLRHDPAVLCYSLPFGAKVKPAILNSRASLTTSKRRTTTYSVRNANQAILCVSSFLSSVHGVSLHLQIQYQKASWAGHFETNTFAAIVPPSSKGHAKKATIRMMKVKLRRYKEERYIIRLIRFLKETGPYPVDKIGAKVLKPRAVFTELEFFLGRPQLFKLKLGPNKETLVDLVDDPNVSDADLYLMKRFFFVQSLEEAEFAYLKLKNERVLLVNAYTDRGNRLSLVAIASVQSFAKGNLPVDTVYLFDMVEVRKLEVNEPEKAALIQQIIGTLLSNGEHVEREPATTNTTTSSSIVTSNPPALKIMFDSRKLSLWLSKQLRDIQIGPVYDVQIAYGLALEASNDFAEYTGFQSAGGGAYGFRRDDLDRVERDATSIYPFKEEEEQDVFGTSVMICSRAAQRKQRWPILFQKSYRKQLERYGIREQVIDPSRFKPDFYSQRPITVQMARACMFQMKYLGFVAYQLFRDVERVKEKLSFWTILKRSQAYRSRLESGTGDLVVKDRVSGLKKDTFMDVQFDSSSAFSPVYQESSEAADSAVASESLDSSRAIQEALAYILPDTILQSCYQRIMDTGKEYRYNDIESIGIDFSGSIRVVYSNMQQLAAKFESLPQPPLGVVLGNIADFSTFTESEKVSASKAWLQLLHQVESKFGKEIHTPSMISFGIPGTLHRISVSRGRQNEISSLRLRLIHHFPEPGMAVRDVVYQVHGPEDEVTRNQPLLVLGRAGSGKSNLIRESIRFLCEDLNKNVLVIDSSRSLAGESHRPFGSTANSSNMIFDRARLMAPASNGSVISSAKRDDGMLATLITEGCRNYSPDVLVVDGIKTERELLGIRSVVRRGISVIAGVTCDGLASLLQDRTFFKTNLEIGSERENTSALLSGLFTSVVECLDFDRILIYRDFERNTSLFHRLNSFETEERCVLLGSNGVVRSRFNYDMQDSLEHDAPAVNQEKAQVWMTDLKRVGAVPEPSVSYRMFRSLCSPRPLSATDRQLLEQRLVSLPKRDYFQEQRKRKAPPRLPAGYNPLKWGEVRGMKPYQRPAAILRSLIDRDQVDLLLAPRSVRMAKLKELGEVDENGKPISQNAKRILSLDFPGKEPGDFATAKAASVDGDGDGDDQEDYGLEDVEWQDDDVNAYVDDDDGSEAFPDVEVKRRLKYVLKQKGAVDQGYTDDMVPELPSLKPRQSTEVPLSRFE